MKAERKLRNTVLPFIVLASVIFSCNYGMRAPEPVIVDKPEGIHDAPCVSDTSNFFLNISFSRLFMKHGTDTTNFKTCDELDGFMKKNKQTIGDKLVLKCGESTKPCKTRLDSVINILKTNDIQRFHLVTDLENIDGIKY
jgi:hypothetical protein